MATIRHKRGTLAQLAAAAAASELIEGEPYHVTDVVTGVDMLAIGTGVGSYVFVGVLRLGASDPVPTGYVGAIVRTS